MFIANRSFGSFTFAAVAEIQLERDATGQIIEDTFPLPPGVSPNKYAAGPFCRFRVAQSIGVAGVYVLTVNHNLAYIGECEHLAKRYGSTGYGKIAPRNCHSDGQSTNCKVNSLILNHAKTGQKVTLWFYPTDDRKSVEATLIRKLSPPWNGRQGSKVVAASPTGRNPVERVTRRRTPKTTGEAVCAQDFRDVMNTLFAQALARGEDRIRVRAGEVHREAGGYPAKNHRMPICCGVMKRLMGSGDSLVESPNRGTGASLTVDYVLPRPNA